MQLLGVLPGHRERSGPTCSATQFDAWHGFLRTPADWAPIVRALWVCALYIGDPARRRRTSSSCAATSPASSRRRWSPAPLVATRLHVPRRHGRGRDRDEVAIPVVEPRTGPPRTSGPWFGTRFRSLRSQPRRSARPTIGRLGAGRRERLDVRRASGRRRRRARAGPRRGGCGRGRGRARRACRRGRSRSRARARPAARSSASAKREPGVLGPARACARWPSRTSSASTSASPSSSHGVGSGHAAVPTTTRSAPASSSARASSRLRIPPEACSGAGATAAATAATSSGRTRPERAPSRSTRWMRGAPASAQRRASVDRIVGALDDVVVVAVVQAHGLLAEHVDGGDHLDRSARTTCAAHVSVLT